MLDDASRRTGLSRQRTRPPRPRLPRTRRAADHRRGVRRAAPPQRRAGSRVSRACARGLTVASRRQRAVRCVREGAASGADVVAEQRVRASGFRGVLRAGAAFSRIADGRGVADGGRAEDRRAVDLADVSGWPAGAWGDTWRRCGGRGRHRQFAHDEGSADKVARQVAGADRGARGGFSGQGGLPGAERGAGGGGTADVCQPAQRGGRQLAAARRAGDRVAPAVVLCLRDGRSFRTGCGLPLGLPATSLEMGVLDQRADRPAGRSRGGGSVLRAHRRGACILALRHRRRSLQDRRPGVAAQAWLRRAGAALGHRVEVRGRACNDRAAEDRRAGWAHRCADAGGLAGTDQRGRRAGDARHVAQRGRDRAGWTRGWATRWCCSAPAT